MLSPQRFITVWWIELQILVLMFAPDPHHELEHLEHHWWHWAFYGVLLLVDFLRVLGGRR